MAISKITLNGQTQMDVTQKTVTPEGMRTGVTALKNDGTDITGTFAGVVPSGIKYVWTPADGIGPWNVSGYASCDVDGAAVNDGRGRIWLYLTNNLTVSVTFEDYSQTTVGIVDWGDGSQSTWSHSVLTVTHTYTSGGFYVIEAYQTSGTVGFAFETNAVGQSSSSRNNTVVAVELNQQSFANTRSAFKYCNAMKIISYTGAITTLAAGELDNSPSLEKVYLPSTITTIGNIVFRNCTALKEIHIAATTPPTLGTTPFLNTPSDMVIYVPYTSDHSALTAYQNAWADVANQIQEEVYSS